jgi:tetratricopeptide (TPR) repeat protein
MKKILPIIFILYSLILSGCASKYSEYMDMGKEALKKENYQKAITYFDRAVKENSNQEAKELLKESKEKFEVQSLFNKGSSTLQKKKFDEAIVIFTEIIQNNENNTDLVKIVINAKASLKKAIEQKVKLLLEIANTSIKGKEYATAIKYLSKIVELNANNEEAKKLLKYSENMKNGFEALKNKQYDEAISLFTIASNSKPDDEEAIKMKEEALNSKKELENTMVANNTQSETGNTENFTNQGEKSNNQEIVIEDTSKVQFVNTMDFLINHYNQNFSNLLKGSTEMTSTGYMIVAVQHNYRQTLNVIVPYPEYQSIIDNWLLCLEATNNFLEILKQLEKGDMSAYDTEKAKDIFPYYDLTVEGLNSIR